jgi:hypothetical protein
MIAAGSAIFIAERDAAITDCYRRGKTRADSR